MMHRDQHNVAILQGGMHDFHVNMTDNRNVGMLVHVRTGRNVVQPFLIVQEPMTSMYFNAKSLIHGTVHMGTYIKYLNEAGRLRASHFGMKQERPIKIRSEWKRPITDPYRQLFVTFYMK